MFVQIREWIKWLIKWAESPTRPGPMYLFWEKSGMAYRGRVLLPALTDAEKADVIPQRKFVAKKGEVELVNLTFPVSEVEKTFEPVELGDEVVLELYNIDQAGNPSATPSTLTVTVSDTTPPVQPGMMAASFEPITETPPA